MSERPNDAVEFPEEPPPPVVPGADVDEKGIFRFPNGKSEVFESARVEFCTVLDEAKPEEWLWRERIARGRVTLLEGAGGIGKSWLALDLAARVTRGAPWPGRFPGPEPAGDVLIVAGDPDDWERMIFPRLVRSAADLTRVARAHTIDRYDPLVGAKNPKKSKTVRRLDLPHDLMMLEYRIGQLPFTRLVVIDPLSAFCANDRAYREALRQLDEIAARRNVAIVVIARAPGNPQRNRLVADRRAETVRAVFHVVSDLEDEEKQWLAPVRMNFCAKPQWIPFRISDAGVVWGESVEATPESAVPATVAKERGALRKAVMAWLKQTLEYHDMPVATMVKEATQLGYSEATLRRAREDMQVRTYRQGWGPWSAGFWTLKPEGEEQQVLPPGPADESASPDWNHPAAASDAPAAAETSEIRRAPQASPGTAPNGPGSRARHNSRRTTARKSAEEDLEAEQLQSDLEQFARATLSEFFAAGGLSEGPAEKRRNGHHRANGHSENGRQGHNGKPK